MFDVLVVVVVVFDLVTLPLVVVVVVEFEVVVPVLAFDVVIVFEVLAVDMVLVVLPTVVLAALVLALLAVLAVSLPPQAAPRAPSARTVESARTFFILDLLVFFKEYSSEFPCEHGLLQKPLSNFRGKAK